MGITINNFRKDQKVLTDNMEKKEESIKSGSQQTSTINIGSKKYYKSTSRIRCNEDKDNNIPFTKRKYITECTPNE
jgi:hypothetical protein